MGCSTSNRGAQACSVQNTIRNGSTSVGTGRMEMNSRTSSTVMSTHASSTIHIPRLVQPVSKNAGSDSAIMHGLRPGIPVSSTLAFSPRPFRTCGATMAATKKYAAAMGEATSTAARKHKPVHSLDWKQSCEQPRSTIRQ
jgi:hypothetical protein